MKKVFYSSAILCFLLMAVSCGPSPKRMGREDAKAMKEAVESGDSLAIKAAEDAVEEHEYLFGEQDMQKFVDYLNAYKKEMGEIR